MKYRYKVIQMKYRYKGSVRARVKIPVLTQKSLYAYLVSKARVKTAFQVKLR